VSQELSFQLSINSQSYFAEKEAALKGHVLVQKFLTEVAKYINLNKKWEIGIVNH